MNRKESEIMKRIELDKAFTAKVNEYLVKGYHISTESMRGSQGEIAKVDLIKSNELIRVWMNRESIFSLRDQWSGDMIVIRVSRWNEDASLASYGKTVWTSELETIEEKTYYRVRDYSNHEWYVDTYEEAQQIYDLQMERLFSHSNRRDRIDITNPKSQEIARRYLISKGYYQRVSMDQIKVYKVIERHINHNYYRIMYKGNDYCIN